MSWYIFIPNNTAKTTADNASSVANTALSNSLKAIEDSESAVNISNSAISTANQASTNANTALENSNTAKTKSESAVATATEAQKTAKDALDKVTDGLGTTVWVNGDPVSDFYADDKLDKTSVNSSNSTKPFDKVPFINSAGVMEVGTYVDFHSDNTTGNDYSTRLYSNGENKNTVKLPSGSGTLALTTDNVASATKATQDSDGKQINTTYTKIANNIISAYGTCSTAAGTAAKVVTIADTNWTLKVGTIIGVKFTNSNTASNVTLNVDSTGDKSIYYNNATYTGNSQTICGYANRLVYYMYDGTYWVWFSTGVELNDNNVPSAISFTAGGTQAKTATCHSYSLLAKSYTQVMMHNANTYAGAITMNINSTGAKPIYINGVASSSSNYTLPAGSYFV